MRRPRTPRLVLTASLLVGSAACEGGREEDTPPSSPSSVSLTGTPGSTQADEGTASGGETGADSDDSSSPKLDVGQGMTTGQDPDGDGPNVCEQDIDIVFVMDVSTSMGAFLDTLAQEILVVDEALAALNLPSPAHYGLVVFVDDVALLSAGAPYEDALGLQADFEMWSDFTSSNQQVGGGNANTTWPENSLDGLHAAATGFQWRPAADTLRIVIHTTDDTFWNGPANVNGVNVEHSYTETVQALQDAQIRVFTFTAELGASCSCEDVTAGWETPFAGAPPIPEATDGGAFDIDEVLGGTLSLSEAINASVEGAVCDPYEPVG